MMGLDTAMIWSMTVPPPGAAPDSDPSFGPGPSAGRTRILVVEDNYFVALNVESALLDAGYEVIGVVDNGEEALQSVAEAAPDLVLMDIRLAGELDGIDTAIALRRMNIASLFASAHCDDAIRERGAAADPRGWLVKPFTDAQMLTAVRLALETPQTGH